MAELPVTMQGTIPTVHAQLNGRDALFVADSGAFFNTLTPGAVAEFQLQIDHTLRSFYAEGVGGFEQAEIARAKTFTILGLTVPNVPFVVAGSTFGGGTVGLLGQNVFRIADVEYDLANGVIRLIRPSKDCRDTPLAYWANVADRPYGVIDIESANELSPYTRSVAYVNGTRIRVMFDTGASTSVLRLEAAKRSGITPDSPGVLPGGHDVGIGHRIANSYIATFASFRIGDEEIQHARLRFGDLLLDTDMLIGADFFLSHRVYVASSQRKLYFTYNGGPVFDLSTRPPPTDGGKAPATAAALGNAADVGGSDPADTPEPGSAPEPGHLPKSAAEVQPPDPRLDQPTDAAGYARRGNASAARHDFAAALADLTRACELAPAEARYFYDRGAVHWNNKQADLALADFDHALALKPDQPDALMARASLHAGRHDPAEAIEADLAAADRATAKESDAHLRIAGIYDYIQDPAAALVQYSKWIDSHPRDDLRMAGALNSRCRARALLARELDGALNDCNAALRVRPDNASFLDSRALVYLRQGKYDKAIADYDAALRLRPKIAWSLYGRGLAKLRSGRNAEGDSDIAAATALQPKIAERAAHFGLSP